MQGGMKRWARWVAGRRSAVVRLAVRALSFYVGYRILHHEIYETDTSEPVLIFLGLWLCGLPPALFFDGLRKLGQSAQTELENAADATPHEDESE